MKNRNRRDGNEKEIVEILRRFGYWEPIVNGTHDGNWYSRGMIFAVEIKNGRKPPSARRLTPRESEYKRRINAEGVRLWILTSVDDALAMVEQRYEDIKHPEYEEE